jgi:hypothetical protein
MSVGGGIRQTWVSPPGIGKQSSCAAPSHRAKSLRMQKIRLSPGLVQRRASLCVACLLPAIPALGARARSGPAISLLFGAQDRRMKAWVGNRAKPFKSRHNVSEVWSVTAGTKGELRRAGHHLALWVSIARPQSHRHKNLPLSSSCALQFFVTSKDFASASVSGGMAFASSSGMSNFSFSFTKPDNLKRLSGSRIICTSITVTPSLFSNSFLMLPLTAAMSVSENPDCGPRDGAGGIEQRGDSEHQCGQEKKLGVSH